MKNGRKTKNKPIKELESVHKKIKRRETLLNKRNHTEQDITERKLSEEALRESEEKYRTLVNKANEAISIAQDGILIFVNRRMSELLGVPEGDLVGRAFIDFVWPEDKELVMSNYRKRIAGKVVKDAYDFRIIGAGGKLLWIFISAALIQWKGKPATINLLTDITERKRAEDALRESEEKFAAIFKEASGSMALISLPDLKWIEVNDNFSLITGYNREEILGRSSIDLKMWADPSARDRFLSLVQQNGIVQNFEVDLNHKSGTIRYGLISAHVISIHDKKYMISSFNDITERKQAAEKLDAKEEEYRQLFDASPDGIILIGPDARIVRANIAMARMYQYDSPDDLIGFYPPNFVAPSSRDYSEQIIRRRLNGEDIKQVEYELIRKDGTTFYGETLATILRNKEGKVTGYICITRDTTKRKRAEAALQESEARFRRLSDATFEAVAIHKKGVLLNANDQYFKMFGYAPDELLGKPVLQLTVAPESIEYMMKQVENDGLGPYESIGVRKDGTRFPMEVRVREIKQEGEKIRVGVLRDMTERKKSEAALKESEERYNALFERSLDLIYICDFEGNFIDANNAALNLLGYKKEEIDSLNFASLLNEDQLPLAFKVIQEIKDTGIHKDLVEFKLRCKNGKEVYVESKGSAIMSNGKTVAVQSIARDITERKRAEEAIRESEEKFRRIFEDHSAVKLLIDPDSGDIIDANKSATVYYGWSREELKRMKIEQLNTLTPEEVKKEMEKVRSQKRVQFEFRHRRKDGSIRDVEVFSSKIEIGNKEVLHSIVHDITERKRTEEEVRKLSNAVEQSGSSVTITNLKGEIEYVNPKFVELSGYSAQEVIGQNPRILKSGETSVEEYKSLWDTITSGHEWRGEFHNKKKNGGLFWESATISPIKNADGKITHFLAVKEDITQQKILTEELRQVQKLEGLGTLAGGIAHDFNNILGIILAYVSNIKKDKNDAKKLDRAAETIIKAVQRGKALVQQVLTFARKTETAFGPVNVNDMVMEIVTMIYEMFPKTVTCSQNFDKSIPYINADRSQLHQVLMNLCVNARDAMPKGGVLSINTRNVSVESLRGQHPEASASSYVCIEVSDTGEGMTEEVRKRIFEPFFSTKGIGKGTGLGLAVVFGVIQSHKGFIDVESELGKGTTFRLYLPASQMIVPISVNKKEEKLEEIPGGIETLLVVEDEEMLLTSLQMVLVDKGYKVLSAKDGQQALKIYKEKKSEISLIISDFGLPNISGFELCHQIKNINPNERIILATGFLDPEMKTEFLKAGIQHFLFKPYEISEVLKVIREVLDQKGTL